jgi:hypothetical protein
MAKKLDNAVEVAYQAVLVSIDNNDISEIKDRFKFYVNLKKFNDRENLRKLEKAERNSIYWQNRWMNQNQ